MNESTTNAEHLPTMILTQGNWEVWFFRVMGNLAFYQKENLLDPDPAVRLAAIVARPDLATFNAGGALSARGAKEYDDEMLLFKNYETARNTTARFIQTSVSETTIYIINGIPFQQIYERFRL